MVSMCYFMIIKCFSYFKIPIFKATVAILLFGGNILKLRDRVRDFLTENILLHNNLPFLPLDVASAYLLLPSISAVDRSTVREI